MASSDLEKVWKLAKKQHVAMLTTIDGGKLHARPMGMFAKRDDDRIYFFTDVSGKKDDEIDSDPNMSIAFQSGSSYVAIAGRAAVTNDRAKIKELWSPVVKAWWDSPDDPAIRLLTVTPDSAELWETPGKIVAYVQMFTAAVTGGRPDIGETHKVRM